MRRIGPTAVWQKEQVLSCACSVGVNCGCHNGAGKGAPHLFFGSALYEGSTGGERNCTSELREQHQEPHNELTVDVSTNREGQK